MDWWPAAAVFVITIAVLSLPYTAVNLLKRRHGFKTGGLTSRTSEEDRGRTNGTEAGWNTFNNCISISRDQALAALEYEIRYAEECGWGDPYDRGYMDGLTDVVVHAQNLPVDYSPDQPTTPVAIDCTEKPLPSRDTTAGRRARRRS